MGANAGQMSVQLLIKAVTAEARAALNSFSGEAKSSLNSVGSGGASAKSAIDGISQSAPGIKQLAGGLSIAGIAMGALEEVGRRAVSWILDLPRNLINAAKALGQLAEEAGRYGGSIWDATQKTGVSAEGLTGLKFAAEQSGVSFETLQGSIARQAKSAMAAAQGNGQAGAAYKRLGINVKDASGQLKTGDQLLRESAEALRQIRSPTERAAIAMNLFGRGGAQLLPMLLEGSDGIEKLEKRAHELGLVMSDEAAAGLDYWGDRTEAANEAIAASWRRMGSIVLPVVAELKEAFAWLAVKAASVLEFLFGTPGDTKAAKDIVAAGKAAKAAAADFQEAAVQTDALTEAQQKGIDAVEQTRRARRDAAYAVEDASRAVIDAQADESAAADKAAWDYIDSRRKMAEAEEQVRRTVEDQQRKIIDLYRETQRAAEDATDARRDAARAISDAEAQGAEKISRAQRAVDDATRKLAEERGEVAPLTGEEKAAQKLADAQAELQKARGDAQQAVSRAQEAAADKERDLQRKNEDLAEKWEQMRVEVERVRADADKRIAEARESAVRVWRAAVDNVEKSSSRIVDAQRELARAIERQSDVMYDAYNTLVRALKDVQTAKAGGGGATDNADVPEMAGGGYLRPGQAAVVGEQGPELFSSGTGGSIIPHLFGGGGGGARVFNFNFNAPVYGEQGLKQLIQQAIIQKLQAASYVM